MLGVCVCVSLYNHTADFYSHYAEDGVFEFDGMETLPPSSHRRVDIQTWEGETERWRKADQSALLAQTKWAHTSANAK